MLNIFTEEFSNQKNKNGFSLMEIMVAIFIFLLAMAAVLTFIVQNYKNYQFALEQNMATEEARNAVKSMVKEIREVKSSDTGNYPLENASDQTFSFYSDIDRDSAVEKVRYFRENNNFKKGVIKPTGNPLVYDLVKEVITVLSNNLITTSTPIFFYYNGDYPGDLVNNPLPTPADVTAVKLVRIHLIININPQNPPPDYILDTFVQPRNLKENL